MVGAPLALPPFRSFDDASLADEYGASCTYWLGRHRALTIGPEWSNGEELFKAATMVGSIISNKLGLTGESADTLEGSWDQVAAAGGGLVFLRGDQMLRVFHLPAAVTTAVAVQVAAKALKRLAKQQ